MARKGERSDHHEAFWDVAEPFLGRGELVEGTMMGHQCLRSAAGGFVATVERESGALVVKLPTQRVDALIESGDGQPFAPAGKVFREWVAVPSFDEGQWSKLLHESLTFVNGEG
ncbi:MAG: hypothetical protein HKN24_04140 [Acidimicrobiales bacterium]|nr:hypothetical protein [Acidimicrobiales bacterium]